MSGTNNISEELKALNSSLEINRLNPYVVPESYFEDLAGTVLRRIKALEAGTPQEELELLSPFIKNLSKNSPYTVPDGYFENLDASFVMVDADEEMATISPLLGSLKKEMPYTVPHGYFENMALPAEKLSTKKTAKIILGWKRFAAAAVVTGLIVLAAFYLRGDKEPGMKVLAKVTRDIKNMNEIQKDNLLDFIDAGLSGDEKAQVNDDTRSAIKTLIQGVPEEELVNFEEQTEDLEGVLMMN